MTHNELNNEGNQNMNAVADNVIEAPVFDNEPFGLTEQEQLFANASEAELNAEVEIVPELADPGPYIASDAYDGMSPEGNPVEQLPLGAKLKQQTTAVRLHRSKWGITKKLDRGQVAQAADQFHADRDRVSASKKLIDSSATEYRNCCKLISEATRFWRDVTVPYPELGVRLIRRDKIKNFEENIQLLKEHLAAAVQSLEQNYQALVEKSRTDLGELFNEDDYPASIGHLFSLEWDYPSIDPPAYLKQVAPAIYEQEQKRIQSRFEEAVSLTQQAFIEQFADLVGNLADRLKIGEDGKPKMFKSAAVDGLLNFFDRFKQLNVGGAEELDKLVEEAKGLIQPCGNQPEEIAKKLRTDLVERQSLQSSFADIAGKLNSLIVDKPARKMFLTEDFE